jgi:hypothetical protein
VRDNEARQNEEPGDGQWRHGADETRQLYGEVTAKMADQHEHREKEANRRECIEPLSLTDPIECCDQLPVSGPQTAE